LSFHEREKPISNFRFPHEDFLSPQHLWTSERKIPTPKSTDVLRLTVFEVPIQFPT